MTESVECNILLVDDEAGLREAVCAYFEDEGFQIVAASNAIDGWELAQQRPPDLIISDIMMPGVDGYQFLAQLRDDPRFESVPVVFLTAKGMTADRIQGYEAGVDAYLSKPFDPDELVAIARNLINRRRAATDPTDSVHLETISQQIAELRGLLGSQPSVVATPSSVQVDLTPREQSVLDLVAEGLMNKEIARRLNTSVRNVEKYVSRLFGKTGTNSRTELVRYALKHGLTE
ncbi:two component transcriptional regulator, LuxR family [Rubidibacter lacunae KORDI 51-2]|uniref:Two component transcriptional regulator, LuxR family n=1 Tax=Rubidibacter lacunae KORDI 51-2 TaxID=582515 RepID=U5DJW0_9CHRO|nr:response regulator transcription factor [Rubidibacter lacunae]ERN41976.1 two component transcriptional regulator, LuxR family [Rubidibacter lacunae KORDI 51-2]